MSPAESQQHLRTNLYTPSERVNAEAQREHAKKTASRGIFATFHNHAVGQGCGEFCKTYEPEGVNE